MFSSIINSFMNQFFLVNFSLGYYRSFITLLGNNQELRWLAGILWRRQKWKKILIDCLMNAPQSILVRYQSFATSTKPLHFVAFFVHLPTIFIVLYVGHENWYLVTTLTSSGSNRIDGFVTWFLFESMCNTYTNKASKYLLTTKSCRYAGNISFRFHDHCAWHS